MKFILLIIAFLVSACAPQEEFTGGVLEYVIRPQNNGFSVLIKVEGLGQTDYQVSSYLPQEGPIKTNHTDMRHGYFQLQGAHLFRCPGDISKVRTIKLSWEVSDNWQLANSFGFGSKTQNFQASCRQLADSMFAGGPGLRLTPTRFGVLATSFNYPKTAELINRLQLNMKRVEQFWDDKPGPYFLVLVNRQINGELHQNGGSAHLNSFQLQLKGNESDSALDHLITHEYIHHWNGWIIKGPPVQDEKDHLDIHWFIEGFTDYLAFSLTNTRPAEKSWQNIPLWELKRNYLNNHNYFDVPYAQGRKIAAEFEREIRASGRSLRDFMLDLLQRSKRDPNFYITRDSFLQVMCEGGYFNCDRARNIIERYVVQGQQFKSQA